MTFKPTKKNQSAWTKKYLNGGICPDTSADYKLEFGEQRVSRIACWDALDWLSENDITTLAQAWNECPKPEWLGWMYARMRPSKRDLICWHGAVVPIIQSVGKYSKWQGSTTDHCLSRWRTTYVYQSVRFRKITPVYISFSIEDIAHHIEQYSVYNDEPFPTIKKRNMARMYACNLIRKRIRNPWLKR